MIYTYSLRRSCNLTSVGDVCEAARISLFWAPNGLNELLEERFKFLTGIWTMVFLTGQSWHLLKSWYTSVGPEQGFGCCFADGLNQSLVLSAAQTIHLLMAAKIKLHQIYFTIIYCYIYYYCF